VVFYAKGSKGKSSWLLIKYYLPMIEIRFGEWTWMLGLSALAHGRGMAKTF
jgi:hypothetical protein